jgi:hypothetical protein
MMRWLWVLVCVGWIGAGCTSSWSGDDDDNPADDDTNGDDDGWVPDDDDDSQADDDDADDDVADDDAADDDDDAADDDDTGECTYSDAPDPVGDAPLPGEASPGPSEFTTTDGYSDEYVYDSTSYVKIGARRDWGGTIIFFGLSDGAPGMNDTNTIDANDTGREVQVAFYDPDRQMQNCAWNASCQSTPSSCPNSITYLGWNPVQGGNRCNNGSGVDSVSNAWGNLEVYTTPLHWNPNWDFTDCDSGGCDDPSLDERPSEVSVYQQLRFVRTHVVELRYSIEELAGMDHAATYQEMPTVYTANGDNGPDLWRLFDASGTEVPIDTPAGNEDGFYYENFESPGPWVTMQNDDASYGVGILYENGESSFQGWQLRSLPFNNVRAMFQFGIPAFGTVNARAYLILGSQGTVATEAEAVMGDLAPFGWMDEPAETVSASTPVTIRGWALDNRGVASVEAIIDETTTVPLTYGDSRPDVCLVWPGYPDCDTVGYSGTHDFGPADECPHLIEIVATDTDGNRRTIHNALVTVE